mgnify:CR=1 FL=1
MERYLTDLFISKGIVKEDDREIYEYGLKIGTMYFIDFTVAFLIAVLLGEISTFIVSVIVIGMLRRNAGGFHAKSEFACFILSELYIVGSVVVAKLLKNSSLIFIGAIFAFSFIYLMETIVVKGVVLGRHIDEKNKDRAHHKYTYRTLIRIGIIFLMALCSFAFGYKSWVSVIIYAYLGEVLFIRIS